MNSPKFCTSRGWLTNYALTCGYVESQKKEIPFFEGVSVNMWLDSGIYHVRVHDFTHGKRILWECKETLQEAREVFTQCLKANNLTRKINK